MLFVGACVFAPSANAQVPDSWDEPRTAAGTAADYDGIPCVRGELVALLRNAEGFSSLEHEARLRGDHVAGFIPRIAGARLVLANGSSLEERIKFYASLATVRAVQPNVLGSLLLDAQDYYSPDDPYFHEEWHLENTGQTGGVVDADVDGPEAWNITTGSAGVTVAIIDTGFVVTHPEFAGRFLSGWDFIGEDPDVISANLHGMYVAGMLCARANNGFESASLDQACTILPIRAIEGVFVDDFDAAQGIDYAIAQGADIASMSFKFGVFPLMIDAAVNAAADAGIIMVAAAGNTGNKNSADKNWPAASAHTISVGWTDHTDWRYKNSSNGSTLDFVAPGREVFTISANASGVVPSLSGSSLATPLVAGIVSLMKSLNASLTYDQVMAHLIAGSKDQVGDPLDTPGWDPWYGNGRVNAYASLQALCGCNGGEALIASPQSLAADNGGVIELVIDFGRDFANQTYLTLGSATNGSVPFLFGGVTLRLTPDDYLRKTLAGSDDVMLINTTGVLDANGRAHAMIIIHPVPGTVADVTLFHQTVLLSRDHGRMQKVVALSNKTKTVIEGP